MTVFYYNTIEKNPMTHFDFLILEIGPQWSNDSAPSKQR
jgi:BarA-like signal transduction histidine kinase